MNGRNLPCAKTPSIIQVNNDTTTVASTLSCLLSIEVLVKTIGHPKGTTKMDVDDKKQQEKQCLDNIVVLYSKKRKDFTQTG